jgi:ribosomal subunit interface protein
MEKSSAIEAEIHKKVEKLEKFSRNITACRVSVESSFKHKQKGNLFHVVVNLDVPNAEIVASKDSGDKQAHEDVYVAIRDAFDSVRSQLEAYESRLRSKVKRHYLTGVPQFE